MSALGAAGPSPQRRVQAESDGTRVNVVAGGSGPRLASGTITAAHQSQVQCIDGGNFCISDPMRPFAATENPAIR